MFNYFKLLLNKSFYNHSTNAIDGGKALTLASLVKEGYKKALKPFEQILGDRDIRLESRMEVASLISNYSYWLYKFNLYEIIDSELIKSLVSDLTEGDFIRRESTAKILWYLGWRPQNIEQKIYNMIYFRSIPLDCEDCKNYIIKSVEELEAFIEAAKKRKSVRHLEFIFEILERNKNLMTEENLHKIIQTLLGLFEESDLFEKEDIIKILKKMKFKPQSSEEKIIYLIYNGDFNKLTPFGLKALSPLIKYIDELIGIFLEEQEEEQEEEKEKLVRAIKTLWLIGNEEAIESLNPLIEKLIDEDDGELPFVIKTLGEIDVIPPYTLLPIVKYMARKMVSGFNQEWPRLPLYEKSIKELIILCKKGGKVLIDVLIDEVLIKPYRYPEKYFVEKDPYDWRRDRRGDALDIWMNILCQIGLFKEPLINAIKSLPHSEDDCLDKVIGSVLDLCKNPRSYITGTWRAFNDKYDDDEDDD